MKKKKWVCSGILAALSMMVICSVFFTFFDGSFLGFGNDLVDTKSEKLQSDTLKSAAIGVSREADSLVKQINDALTGDEGYTVSFSGLDLVQNIPNLKTSLKDYPGVKGAVTSAFCMVFIPVFFALLVFGFSWLRNKRSYITAAALSIAGIAALLVISLWLFPTNIYNDVMNADLEEISRQAGESLDDQSWHDELQKLTGDDINLAEEGKTLHIEDDLDINKTVVRSYVIEGLGPAFIICAISLALMLAASFVGILLSLKPDTTDVEMGLICYFGPLSGEKIPVYADDYVTLGSDSSCNVVIKELAPIHCAVSWSEKSHTYIIANPENAKIILENGRELKPGGGMQLRSGESMFLGNKGCRVTMN